MLTSNIPKAIGTKRSGSNFLTIAKYKRTKETKIITQFCHDNDTKPEL